MEFNILKDSSLVLIFTYAPAGLGHLRVADALYDGLPEDIPHAILGSEDRVTVYFHRFTSIHPFARYLLEKTQHGILEDLFTYFYRRHLRKKSEIFYGELLTALEKRKGVKTALIVSTHFGLAHKVGAMKEKLEKTAGVKIVLMLQVTDDSPQQLWYVPEADIIFVPSQYTKDELLKYAQNAKFRQTKVEVLPYPISPYLGWQLSEDSYRNRISQVDPRQSELTHFLVPMSGAAVGMEYFLELTENLYNEKNRYKFHFIIKKTVYTQFFLKELQNKEYIDEHVFESDKEMIHEYEEEYKNKVISIEITKPSEQAFKSLLNPTQIGGSILLLTRPVGRQEYDNINFLRRHFLIPKNEMQSMLWREANKGVSVEKGVLEEAKFWRGLRLPDDPHEASKFINWCLEQGIFYEMMKYRQPKNHEKVEEVQPNGVEQFWKKVIDYLKGV